MIAAREGAQRDATGRGCRLASPPGVWHNQGSQRPTRASAVFPARSRAGEVRPPERLRVPGGLRAP